MAEYRRAVPKIRVRRQMIARYRPTITIVEKDSAGKPAKPMTVVADTVFMDGDSLIYANGQVTINRPDISATADSAFIDEGRETMSLMRGPKLTGTKDRPFTLSGDLIDLFSKDRKLSRVIARANAVAVSDSLTLKSDTIDLRMKNDLLDHAYAWGMKSRARAVSPSQNILADSLDVFMPGQRVQLVRALRKAFAQGKPDTTRFKVEKSDSTDWLQGDTITAHFDSTAVAKKDTSKSPTIKQLVSVGNARSLRHIAPNDTAERRPAINHVIAGRITIDFDSQKVATVTTVDSVFGIYIEPRSDTASARRASAGTTPKQTPNQKPLPKSIVPLPPAPKKP
jgi:lipopolysaccharide export system protein LptA